jgi:hypothetical protein
MRPFHNVTDSMSDGSRSTAHQDLAEPMLNGAEVITTMVKALEVSVT